MLFSYHRLPETNAYSEIDLVFGITHTLLHRVSNDVVQQFKIICTNDLEVGNPSSSHGLPSIL